MRTLAVIACALPAATPCEAASLIATSTSSAIFASGHKFQLHIANGYYWAVIDKDTPTGPDVFSSPNAISWTPQGSIFSFGVSTSSQQWATRFSGNTVIAFAYLNSSNLYYRKGTLNSDGTVTWDTEVTTGPATGWPAVNALIANGRPIMWRNQLANTDNGILRRGDRLSPPPAITWTDTTATPPLNPPTQGGFRAGALFPTGGSDPDDLIILRATTTAIITSGYHYLVALKYNDGLSAYDAAPYNVSLCGGCGLTETAETQVKAATEANIQPRFAAAQDTSGNIHAMYVNNLDQVVHYKKDVGFNDSWTRISADVTQSSPINKITLAAADLNNLYLFYSKSDQKIYYKRFNGTAWGPENIVKSNTNAISNSIATTEMASGCSVGVGWEEGDNAMFELITGDCPTAVNSLYRSVGITATNLNTGLETVAISSSTATFSGPMPPNIGVGDVLVYNSGGARLAFIHGRTSSNVFTVVDKNGGTPTAAPALTAVAVYRAYTSLKNWESQIENPNISEPVEDDVNPSTNLVTANTVMMVACYGDGEDTGSVYIDSWTTGSANYIKIYTPTSSNQVGTSQRHNGAWDTSAYRLTQDGSYFAAIGVKERYVRIDGLQLTSNVIVSTESNGIHCSDGNSDLPVEIHISNNIVRTTTAGLPDVAFGIGALSSFGTTTFDSSLYVAKVWNNIVYGYTAATSSTLIYAAEYGTMYAYNNTLVGVGAGGTLRGIAQFSNTVVHAKNNISIDSADPYRGTFSASSTNNFSDIGDAPGLLPKTRDGAGANPVFVGGIDYHLNASDTWAQDQGADLSSDPNLVLTVDIDGGLRTVLWDIGADDVLATTAVELVSFTASGFNRAVELRWETGSELDNLGFHLYRSLTEEGPYERITGSVIPGLGSSPAGAKYSYRDSGLANGVTYYYKLEDIETTGASELHGPVSATPSVGAAVDTGGEAGGEEASSEGSAEDSPQSRITYGNPEENQLLVRRRGKRFLELELLTEGFYAIPQEDGTVRLEIPGFEEVGEPEAPDVPVYRTWQDVVAGRKVELASVTTEGLEEFTSLRPSSTEPVVVGSEDGTVQAGRRRKNRRPASVYYPEKWAEVVSVGFQGAVKKALVELAPVRWDETYGRLVLARRLVVRVSFGERDGAELRLGRSHREVGSHANRSVLARMALREPGLYGVSYQSLFGKKGKALRTSELRLSRQGEAVAFYVSPNALRFGPRSTLYFVSDGESLNPYGHEVVYELEESAAGERMEELAGAPSGAPVAFYWKTEEREENLLYQATFKQAESLWQWDWLLGGMRKSYPFEVRNLSAAAESSRLQVWLHGASDFPEEPDHHVRVYVNGTLVGEDWWDGESPHVIEAELGPGWLQEGENTLEVEEAGDTGAQYSLVMLDRFEVSYPAELVGEEGELKGSFSESGTAFLPSGEEDVYVLDVTGAPQWLSGVSVVEGVSSFRVEGGRNYLAVSESAVKTPEVSHPESSSLKRGWNRAEYLVVGPRAFLEAAEPLLELRREQGLISGAVAVEDIYQEFGYGEATPDSMRDFLSYVYHHWSEPTVRYVLLLGDATYDTKDYLGTGVESQVPVKMVKTRYIWTASDPWLGAVNGEDILPDVAVGRLPAASVEEVELLVEKILAYEAGQGDPLAPAVLVADNADIAGDFVSDAEELASTVLSGEPMEKIYLSELGAAATRSAIIEAFDRGASLISYMGHGAIHLWANENLLNIWQVPSLSPQSQQPILLTMNCLNGYFHFPYFNSLSEELLKAEGKGVIAAFSPSGFSLNDPAHRFHKALLEEMVNGGHVRLGDAVLAGQAAYAETGAFPELLSIYHLLGDPGLRLR